MPIRSFSQACLQVHRTFMPETDRTVAFLRSYYQQHANGSTPAQAGQAQALKATALLLHKQAPSAAYQMPDAVFLYSR